MSKTEQGVMSNSSIVFGLEQLLGNPRMSFGKHLVDHGLRKGGSPALPRDCSLHRLQEILGGRLFVQRQPILNPSS